jgi:hypothetical protein
MALFGMTAKDWRDRNPGQKGNIRDYADISQLVCLSNLENLNAHFILIGFACHIFPPWAETPWLGLFNAQTPSGYWA